MFLKAILLKLIGLYRRCVSPLLPPACRFYPTCSAYALKAVERFGAFKGGILQLIVFCDAIPIVRVGWTRCRLGRRESPFFKSWLECIEGSINNWRLSQEIPKEYFIYDFERRKNPRLNVREANGYYQYTSRMDYVAVL